MNATYQRIVLAYKEWLGLLGYSQSSVKSMPRRIAELFAFLEENGTGSLQEIEQGHILRFYRKQKERASKNTGRPLSNSTLNAYLRNLRLLAQYLSETGQCFLETDIPNEPKTAAEREVLSQSGIKQVYRATGDSLGGLRERALLGVYYGCGLRGNEGIHLDVNDILLEKGLLYVRRGKGKKERYVPFTGSLQQDFKEYLDYCRPQLLKENNPQEAFLINNHGRRMTYANALAILKTLQQKTGDEGIRNKQIGLHSLRHSIATHLLEQNMPLEEISRFLGHKSIYSTEVYTHVGR